MNLEEEKSLDPGTRNAWEALKAFYMEEIANVDVSWLQNEIELYMSNTKELYDLIHNTDTDPRNIAIQALVYALNGRSDKELSLEDCLKALQYESLDLDEVVSKPIEYVNELREEDKEYDNLTESKELDEDLLDYMYNESEFGNDGASYIPDYDDITYDYDDTISKEQYNQCYNYIKDLAHSIKYYEFEGITYIQLSDNKTLNEITVDNLDIDYYVAVVASYLDKFKQQTGVDVYQAGRMGKHICVDNTLSNAQRYEELQDKLLELEKDMIDFINGDEDNINESLFKASDDVIDDSIEKGLYTESEEDVKVINPDDKDFYDNLYKVFLYSGVGVSGVIYKVYADYEEQALEIAVAYAEDNAPGVLTDIEEVSDDEESLYIYIDATEYGVSKPYYISVQSNVEELDDALTESEEYKGMDKKLKDFARKCDIDVNDLDEVLYTIDDEEGMFGDSTGELQQLRDYIYNDLLTEPEEIGEEIGEEIVTTLNSRRDAIIRLIAKYKELGDVEKVSELEQKLKDVEIDIENYSNPDKPMIMHESINVDGFQNDVELQKYFQKLHSLPDEITIDGKEYKMDMYGDTQGINYVIYTDVDNDDSYIKVFYTMNEVEPGHFTGVNKITGVSDLRESKELSDSELSHKRLNVARELYNKSHKDDWSQLTSEEQAHYFNRNYKKINSIALQDSKYTESKIVRINNTVEGLLTQLRQLGMTEEQAQKTAESIVNIFKSKSPQIVSESKEDEDILDNLSTQTIDKVSKIVYNMIQKGWDGDINKVKQYYDKVVEENKKLEEDEDDNTQDQNILNINQEEDQEETTALDLLQDRIGEELSIAELNTILQSIFGKYNQVFLLTVDVQNMEPDESNELVVNDDGDIYVITYVLKDVLELTVEITDVYLD